MRLRTLSNGVGPPVPISTISGRLPLECGNFLTLPFRPCPIRYGEVKAPKEAQRGRVWQVSGGKSYRLIDLSDFLAGSRSIECAPGDGGWEKIAAEGEGGGDRGSNILVSYFASPHTADFSTQPKALGGEVSKGCTESLSFREATSHPPGHLRGCCSRFGK